MAVSRAVAICPTAGRRHRGGRADVAAAGGRGRRVRGVECRETLFTVRGHEPVRELQRQRHVSRIYACPVGRSEAGSLCFDGQHQCFPSDVFRRHAPDEGHYLRRVGQDRLRKAVPSTGLRCSDASDCGRLRRCHGAGAGSFARSGYLSGEQRKPISPRRSESHHVSRPGIAFLAGSGLDCRAGRQFGQLKRIW